jgi:hypothetical protein
LHVTNVNDERKIGGIESRQHALKLLLLRVRVGHVANQTELK